MQSRNSLSRTSSVLLAVLATFAFVAAAGGGGDETVSKSSEERETTTTEDADPGIASGILDRATSGAGFDSDEFDSDVEECIGESVIDSVGESGAEDMMSADPADYSSEQVDALVQAFNDCVPGSAMAPSLVSSFYEGMGATEPSDPTMVDCVADEIDGRTGELVGEGLAVEATDAFPELTLQVMDKCMPPEDLTALLTDAFASSGLTETQASCVAAALEGQISVTELAEAGMGTGSPELEAKVQAAAAGCQ